MFCSYLQACTDNRIRGIDALQRVLSVLPVNSFTTRTHPGPLIPVEFVQNRLGGHMTTNITI